MGKKYSLQFSEKALKQLHKLDKQHFTIILNWLEKNIDGCENPRQHGKPLSANLSGSWRYRIGDYRVIANIQDEKVVVLVLTVGHRKDIYK